MATTDKDLDTKRRQVEKLRKQVESTRDKRTNKEAEQQNAVQMQRLEAEEARLQQELVFEQRLTEVQRGKRGSVLVESPDATSSGTTLAANTGASTTTTGKDN